MKLFRIQKPQCYRIVPNSAGVKIGVVSNVRYLSERKEVFGYREIKFNGFRFLGLDAGPSRLLPWNEEVNNLLIIPKELTVGRDSAQHFAQLFQHFHLPLRRLAWWKPFLAEVPFAAELLPRHGIFNVA